MIFNKIFQEFKLREKRAKNKPAFMMKILNENIPDFEGFGKVTNILKSSKRKWCGYCKREEDLFGYGEHKHKIYFKEYLYEEIGTVLILVMNNEKVDLSKYGHSLKVFMHELYHTKFRFNVELLEESFTELNAQLSLQKDIKRIFGIEITKEDLELSEFNPSYQRHIIALLEIFDIIGLDREQRISLIKDIKNIDIKITEENKYKLFDWVYNLPSFIGVIDKFPFVYYCNSQEHYVLNKNYKNKEEQNYMIVAEDKKKKINNAGYIELQKMIRHNYL